MSSAALLQHQSTLSTSTAMSRTAANYKRKCSDTINKAASSLVHLSTGLSELASGASYGYGGGAALGAGVASAVASSGGGSPSDNFEIMSKVTQVCVADMIKYSMDLFTVPVENFEKLPLSATLRAR